MGWALTGVGFGALIMLLAVRSGRRTQSRDMGRKRSLGLAWSATWLLIGAGLAIGQVSKVVGGVLLVTGMVPVALLTGVLSVLSFFEGRVGRRP